MKRAASSETTEMKSTIDEGSVLPTNGEVTMPVSVPVSVSTSEVSSTHELPRTISIDGMSSVTKKHRVCHDDSPSETAPVSTSTSTVVAVSPFQDKNYTNLISETTSKVLFATDEWFARAENLIKDSPPVFDPDLYCSEGKVMDGWESRRRRTEGHDWCVIATDGRTKGYINDVIGIEIDTAYFTGNQAPKISVQVANCYPSDDNASDIQEEEWMYTWMPGALKRLIHGGGVQGTGQTPIQVHNANAACEKFEWKEVLPMTPLQPGYEESRMHYFIMDDKTREMAKGFTHVRINYFPDGGVARLKLWGHSHLRSDTNMLDNGTTSDSSVEAMTDDETIVPSAMPYHHPELSLSTNGGLGLACSNKHYGVPQNLIRPTYGKDMSDGWETARHPDRPPVLIRNPVTNLIDNPLSDWAVLKLGMGGTVDKEGISRVIIDTKHFKGNFPESVMVEGCNCNANGTTVSDDDVCSVTPDKANQNESSAVEWFPILTRTTMGADREHVFDKEQLQNSDCAVTHIRVSIYPDGGISRVRVYGQPAMKN